jgi:hypothetical protein
LITCPKSEWLKADDSNSGPVIQCSKDRSDKMAAVIDSIVVWFNQSGFQVIWYLSAQVWLKTTM